MSGLRFVVVKSNKPLYLTVLSKVPTFDFPWSMHCWTPENTGGWMKDQQDSFFKSSFSTKPVLTESC